MKTPVAENRGGGFLFGTRAFMPGLKGSGRDLLALFYAFGTRIGTRLALIVLRMLVTGRLAVPEDRTTELGHGRQVLGV